MKSLHDLPLAVASESYFWFDDENNVKYKYAHIHLKGNK